MKRPAQGRNSSHFRRASAARPPLNGLDYVEAWRDAWVYEHQGEGGSAQSLLLQVSNADGPDELEPILARIEAFEAHHPDDPLVRFCSRPDVLPLDCAILAAALSDRIVFNDGLAGLRVLDLVREATHGIGGVAAGVEHSRRLRADAPVVREGLIEVLTGDGDRWLDSLCTATTCLVSWAIRALPVNCIEGGQAFENADFPTFGKQLRRAPTSGRPAEEPTEARLVLPPIAAAALDRAVSLVRTRELCLNELGLGRLLPEGKGVAILLYGPPGCGKTLAARVLARRLGCAVRVLSSAQLQSKYFGECEARIAAEVRSAERDGSVLVFDEADAVVVDRSTAPHPAYRSATNALLRAVEESAGVIVFTTNAADCLDPALERRLALRIEVPPPGPAERRRIWEGLLPDSLPLEHGIDLGEVAACDLTGGEIKNAVLAAVSDAAARDPLLVTRADLQAGIEVAMGGRWNRHTRQSMGFRPGSTQAAAKN